MKTHRRTQRPNRGWQTKERGPGVTKSLGERKTSVLRNILTLVESILSRWNINIILVAYF